MGVRSGLRMKKAVIGLTVFFLLTLLLSGCGLAEGEEAEFGENLQPLSMEDYTAYGPEPDEACYTEGKHIYSNENTFDECTYSDKSIRVWTWREWRGDCCFNVARVKIADPSQLRTAMAQDLIYRNNYVWATAKAKNAVVASGGEWLSSNGGTYTVRMGVTLRAKGYRKRDVLVTDQNGDFHLFKGFFKEDLEKLEKDGFTLINVFNFGPAMIIDGELQYHEGDTWEYVVGFTRSAQPRTGFGQIGPLEYLMVVTDGRNAPSPLPEGGTKRAKGCNVSTLAKYMYDYGCVQAYNLDGGGSAAMYFHGERFSNSTKKRAVTDIVYFATLTGAGYVVKE